METKNHMRLGKQRATISRLYKLALCLRISTSGGIVTELGFLPDASLAQGVCHLAGSFAVRGVCLPERGVE